MTTTLGEVAAALAEQLGTIPELNAYDHVPGTAEWPGAFIRAPHVVYEGLALDDEDLSIEIILLVSAAFAEGQLDILPFMEISGPQSIPAAIHDDRTLGLDDVDVYVTLARPLGLQEQASYRGYGVIFELSVRVG